MAVATLAARGPSRCVRGDRNCVTSKYAFPKAPLARVLSEASAVPAATQAKFDASTLTTQDLIKLLQDREKVATESSGTKFDQHSEKKLASFESFLNKQEGDLDRKKVKLGLSSSTRLPKYTYRVPIKPTDDWRSRSRVIVNEEPRQRASKLERSWSFEDVRAPRSWQDPDDLDDDTDIDDNPFAREPFFDELDEVQFRPRSRSRSDWRYDRPESARFPSWRMPGDMQMNIPMKIERTLTGPSADNCASNTNSEQTKSTANTSGKILNSLWFELFTQL